ncbi:Tn3 family transposase [Streptomyces sp. ME19-01-6]|nr:Tn3 family transposase [Streptomyces sp. ME19-01-6]MDX3226004.1 Tn3 family transposase [Streptomyces sp. ME19-01-6]
MRHPEAKAIDEALDLFQVLMAARLLNTAKRKTEKERLSTLPQLEKASRLVAPAWEVMVEELELVEEHGADLDVAALWAALEEIAPRAAMTTAAATVVTPLLQVVNPVDDTYRRQMNRQLTVQESRHKPARDVCHGKRGTIHQAYKYIDAAVDRLRAEEHEVRDEDIARHSPLKHKNLNLLGHYSFTASTPAAGALRPLRDPDAPELDDDEDGSAPG